MPLAGLPLVDLFTAFDVCVCVFVFVCLCVCVCVSSLRRGHANILCIVQIITDDPRRELRACHSLGCVSVGFV